MRKFRIPYFWLLASPLTFFAVGAAFNILAVSANHGMMPVALQSAMRIALEENGILTSSNIIDAAHKVMEHGDHLKFLCDWIQIPHLGTLSLGDVFMELGEYLKGYFWGAWLALIARDSTR